MLVQTASVGLSALGELSLRRLSEKLAELTPSTPIDTGGSASTTTSNVTRQLGVVENSAFNTITDQYL